MAINLSSIKVCSGVGALDNSIAFNVYQIYLEQCKPALFADKVNMSNMCFIIKSTDPRFDSRWYTFGFIPDVATNCKAFPG